MTGSEQLEQVALVTYDCIRCGLCESRTSVVFGDGSAEADIMLIGEGPGENEDKTGLPFVGQAGQLLSKMLEHCFGLTRDDVYIANIVKCRPPNNRDPEPFEIARCMPFLWQQIQIIQPKVIITLGRVATQSLLEVEDRIGQLRGKRFEYESIPVVPTWHPSYLLRRPFSRHQTVEDMKVVKEILSGSLDSATN